MEKGTARKDGQAPRQAQTLPVLCALGLALLVTADWCSDLSQAVALQGFEGAPAFVARIAGAVAFVACAALPRKARALALSRGAGAGVAACLLAGQLAQAYAGLLPAAGQAVAAAGAALYGIAWSVLLLHWIARCCDLEPSTIAAVFPLAYLVPGITYFVLAALDAHVATFVLCLLPCASGLLFLAASARLAGSAAPARMGGSARMRAGGERSERHDGTAIGSDAAAALAHAASASNLRPASAGNLALELHPHATERSSAAAAPPSPAPAPAADLRPAVDSSWTFPIYPVALMVIFKFVFYFSLSLTSGPSMYGPLGILAVATCASAGALFFYERFHVSLLYKAALPCLVAGLLILAWVHVGSSAATMLSNAGNIAFELFILISLAEACRRYGIDAYWLFGIVQAASSVFGWLGFQAGLAFTAAYPGGSYQSNLLMMLVVVALVALSTLFFNERMAGRTFGSEPVEPAHAAQPAATGAAVHAFGLDGQASQPSADARIREGDGADEADAHGNAQAWRTTDAADAPTGTEAPLHPALAFQEDLQRRCDRLARQYGLSRREVEILELLAQGMSAARIQEELVISRNTVKSHTRHIYEKLGVHSRDEARALVEQAQ